MHWRIVFLVLVFLSSITSASAYQAYHSGGSGMRFYRQEDALDGIKLPEPIPTVVPPPTTTAPPRIPDCSGTCQFTNSAATQFLVSCDGSCVCVTKAGVMDAPSWNVLWNGTICTISESGPCGRGDGGMVMACQPGLKCIEKRCREPSRIGTLELGWACDDSLDCQSGLACVSDENSFPIHKTCRVLPKSLFRIW